MKRILHLLLVFNIFFYSSSIFASENNFRFIVIGHMYPIINNENIFKKITDKINFYKPDVVFVLGDSNLHDEKSFRKLNNSINSELYFSPGNHELYKNNIEGYLKNVGYLDRVLIKNDINFILLNSSEDKNQIIDFIKKNLDKKKINLILTHHRIWDDTIVDDKKYSHDKSYYFEEIYPYIKDNVSAIFSGNSKRQYFRDLTDHDAYGKQNVNLIYWMDKIGKINLYSIGMGDGSPKASFVIVDILDDKMIVNGDFVSNKNYEILPRELIVKNETKLNLNNINKIREVIKEKYIILNKIKFIIAISGLILLTIILTIFKRYFNYLKKNK